MVKKRSLESILSKTIIEMPVRMTIHKLAKLGEYLQANLMPQYNMPTLSKKDYDTLSPTVNNHIINKNYKYKLAY